MMFRQSTRMIKAGGVKILIDSTITAGQGQAAMLAIAVVDLTGYRNGSYVLRRKTFDFSRGRSQGFAGFCFLLTT